MGRGKSDSDRLSAMEAISRVSLINLQLPLENLSRIVGALERIAVAAESITAHLCVPIPDPVYDKSKRHTGTPNFQLIAQIEQLNDERRVRGEPALTVNEAVAHLRNEVE